VKKGEAPFPQDNAAMQAYSLAMAHSAELNEPDLPTNYGTRIEKEESRAELANDASSDADKTINSLFNHSSKEHMAGSSLGVELIQLNAEVLSMDDDDVPSEAPADDAAAQTDD